MTEQAAAIGHNRPPPYDEDTLAKLRETVNEFADAAGEWAEKGAITTQDEAETLNDFLSGARKLSKQVDAARAEAKKPHDDAAKAVQAAFTPLLKVLDKSTEKAKKLLTAFAEAERRKAEEERRRKEAEARAAAEEAARLAAEASARNDLVGEVAAEEAAREAERLAKEAAKDVKVQIGSATGGGRTAALRTIRRAQITNINLLFMHYRARPEVAETLLRLANADIRAADVDEAQIPGIEIVEERSVA